MQAFRVWLQPAVSTCRVRVDGIKNAEWLLGRLSQSFVFKTSQPLLEEANSNCCSFQVVFAFRTSWQSLGKMLAAMPEVQLIENLAK